MLTQDLVILCGETDLDGIARNPFPDVGNPAGLVLGFGDRQQAKSDRSLLSSRTNPFSQLNPSVNTCWPITCRSEVWSKWLDTYGIFIAVTDFV